MKECEQRIVVTGMGAVTPVGNDVQTFWQNIISGVSGVEPIDPSINSQVHFSASVKNFDPSIYFSEKELKSGIHRSAWLSTAALTQALQNGNILGNETIDFEQIGIRTGTGIAGATYVGQMQKDYDRGGDKEISVRAIFEILAERTATVPSMKYGIKGPIAASVAACASGNQAIIDAVRTIKDGDAKIMIALGVDSLAQDPLAIGCFTNMRALSTKNDRPTKASQPFDQAADGFVFSEGAGALVLESLEHALIRNAQIYAELIGYGEASDAYHPIKPSGTGAAKAMTKALMRAGITPDQVDYIDAHGTATPDGDRKETWAMNQVFAGYEKRPLVSSIKSMIGHPLGAAGIIESIACIMAIQDGIVPPTINLENPINDYFDYVPNKARAAVIDIAMNNSFGVGGLNTVTIFKRYTPNL